MTSLAIGDTHEFPSSLTNFQIATTAAKNVPIIVMKPSLVQMRIHLTSPQSRDSKCYHMQHSPLGVSLSPFSLTTVLVAIL